MENKGIYLTQDQLNFIRFVSENASSYPDLRARINSYTERMNEPAEASKGSNDSRIHQNLHIPKEVSQFLTAFTRQDTALRYITHNWDANQFESYTAFEEQYISDLKREAIWRSDRIAKDNRLYAASKKLYYLIQRFLLETDFKPWHDSPKYLKFGLGNIRNYIDQWMKANPGSQPRDMPLAELPEEFRPDENSLDGGMVLLCLGDILEIFRKSICFKGQELYHMIRKYFSRSDFTLDSKSIQTLKGISFYTDTQRVEDAFHRILSNLLNYKNHSELVISGKIKDHLLTLTILQKGSYAECDYRTDKLMLRGKGDMIDIKKSLQSLCDFSIRSKFKDDSGVLRTGEIAYLYSSDFDNPPKITWYKDDCEGFEYILNFYL